MIWFYTFDDEKDLNTSLLENLLNDKRRSQMSHYRFDKDKKLCLMAFVLLRYGLHEEYRIEETPDIKRKGREKPVFSSLPLHFNLSHCENAVACILDGHPVGIDIQNEDEAQRYFSDSFLTEREKSRTRGLLREITRIWTLKEAYGKRYGYGICYDYKKKDFSLLNNEDRWQSYEGLSVYSYSYGNYALSAFSSNKLKVIKVFTKDLMNFEKKLRKW